MVSFKNMLNSLGFRKEEITGKDNYKPNPIIEMMSKEKGRDIMQAAASVWSREKLGRVKGMPYALLAKRPQDINKFHNDLCHFKAGRVTQTYFNNKYGFDPTDATRFGISLIIKRYNEMGFDFRSPYMIYCQEKKLRNKNK